MLAVSKLFQLPPLSLRNRVLRSSKPISIGSHINTNSAFSSPIPSNPFSTSQHKHKHFSTKATMVALLVATSSDPASINPANALLAMPGWQPGPHFQVQSINLLGNPSCPFCCFNCCLWLCLVH